MKPQPAIRCCTFPAACEDSQANGITREQTQIHNMNSDTMTATQARTMAKEINAKCSACFSDAKAVKSFGQWVIKIGGGRECCYGKTLTSVEDATSIIRIFEN